MQEIDLRRFGIYTMAQAAEFIGCDRTTIYRRIGDGVIPEPYRFGSMRVFKRKQLMKAKKGRENGATTHHEG
ncbi:MAG TPA: helix-turn-helix domain-containing protein [Urbifossiella sp.]|nr:helix-turn-helix domain-containing protein [Urbifossiella sp.]